MGTPIEKQRMPEDRRANWQNWFNEAQAEPIVHVRELAESVQFGVGRAARKRKTAWISHTVNFVQPGNFDQFCNYLYPADETPLDDGPQSIDSFQLARRTVSNAVYRLFDPSHGQRPSPLWLDNYFTVSQAHDQPAIYLNWFDSWVLCQWLRWEGESCKLPSEQQWEYSAKFRCDWESRYWWGDALDLTKCNIHESGEGATIVPMTAHANPNTQAIDDLCLGLMDMLGNVWEWCQDVYRSSYDAGQDDDSGQPNTSRVLRGGSFDFDADNARCSVRFRDNPSIAVHDFGCRVARAEPRKS